MDFKQRQRLSALLVSRREAAQLSSREVARRAGVNVATVSRIERGQIANPKAESIQAIARALRIPVFELFSTVGWVTAQELPTIRPYLRTKYRQLPPDAMHEIEAHFADLAKKHGIHFDPAGGPQSGEDE